MDSQRQLDNKIMIAIEFNNIWKSFRKNTPRALRDVINIFLRQSDVGTFWALKDISFEVEKGKALGIIGPNGAGKTTVLKLLAGILRQSKGNIKTNGRVSTLIELGTGFHTELTGRENIWIGASILGLPKFEIKKRFDSIVELAGLEEFIDMPVKHYSQGMYLRLGFAVAVSVDFDVLLIDEVLAVGDEIFQKKCLDRMLEFKKEGKTFVFVSHNLGQIARFCDTVVLLDKGEVLTIGSPYWVIEKYLDFVQEEEEREGDKKFIVEKEYTEKIGTRWGTREIEITNVKFLDSKGGEKDIFNTGETMVIRIEFFAKEKIEKPVFGIAIHTINGVHINGPNTKISGFEINNVEGKGYIDYIVDSLPFYEGTCLISVSVYDYSVKYAFDHIDKRFMFRIRGRQQDEEGMMYIPARWKISLEHKNE